MAAIQTDDGTTYEYIKATVTSDGIELIYQAVDSTEGTDIMDEVDAEGWSVDQVQRAVAQYLGITSGESGIEVS